MPLRWECPDRDCDARHAYFGRDDAELEDWIEFHEEMWHGIPPQREPS